MLPSIFGENLFDEFFGNAFDNDFWSTQNPLYGKRAKNLMKTDVKEEEDAYSIAIDLPGFDKDNVQAHLEDGYLTVTANKSSMRRIRRAVISVRSAIPAPAAAASMWVIFARTK